MVIALAILALGAQQTDVEREAGLLFAWMDSLGYEKLLSKPFVEVYRSDFPEPPFCGFLLHEDADTAEIFTPELASYTVHKSRSGDGTPFISIRESRFDKLVGKEIAISKGQVHELSPMPFGCILESLAWICAKRGKASEAKYLIDVASRQKLYSSDRRESLSPVEVIAHAKRSVLFEMIQPEILRFADRKFTLKQLRDRFKAIINRIPSREDAKEFIEIETVLEAMVEDERKHPVVDPTKLPPKEQISEYIWRLPRMFSGYPLLNPNPYYELKKIGRPALPQLRMALNDDRFTRDVMMDRSGGTIYFSIEHIFRVKDIVKGIIEEIEKDGQN